MSGALDFWKRGQYCRLNISTQLGNDDCCLKGRPSERCRLQMNFPLLPGGHSIRAEDSSESTTRAVFPPPHIDGDIVLLASRAKCGER